MLRRITFLFICGFICLQAGETVAQCYPQRYNTSPNTGWVSCEASESPNAERGESIWLQYDLGKNLRLQSSWIWNHNSITSLNDGVISYVVDYKSNGLSSWKELGTYSLNLSDGSAYYQGEQGPDFAGIKARYILFTVLQNGGGDCSGFGEWKIETTEVVFSDLDEIAGDNWFTVYPNPANEFITLEIPEETHAHTVEILDNLGKSQMGLTSIHSRSMTIDLSTLVNGMYTVCLVNNTTRNCQKISVFRE